MNLNRFFVFQSKNWYLLYPEWTQLCVFHTYHVPGQAYWPCWPCFSLVLMHKPSLPLPCSARPFIYRKINLPFFRTLAIIATRVVTPLKANFNWPKATFHPYRVLLFGALLVATSAPATYCSPLMGFFTAQNQAIGTQPPAYTGPFGRRITQRMKKLGRLAINWFSIRLPAN